MSSGTSPNVDRVVNTALDVSVVPPVSFDVKVTVCAVGDRKSPTVRRLETVVRFLDL